jgi:hypothetical protein
MPLGRADLKAESVSTAVSKPRNALGRPLRDLGPSVRFRGKGTAHGPSSVYRRAAFIVMPGITTTDPNLKISIRE